MQTRPQTYEIFEISPRFRKTVEERIEKLERDAVTDELALPALDNEDHLRRHRKLIAIQRTEALRMRIFLDQARTRLTRPLIEL